MIRYGSSSGSLYSSWGKENYYIIINNKAGALLLSKDTTDLIITPIESIL